ncbi:hypothetical protein GGI15_003959 [Coemansia interrupta]|uniref:Uncharacterized protein n=1 Tax=Coemansia interrupta TaxID=1126814 RepID=A0A9W8LG67_9FUNG|nr:hypothetical protein GGI15_003959 [Coemansia interrupta]
MPSRRRAAGRPYRSRQVAPDSANSPTMTIDNDSYSSTRPHIMGYPGTRVLPVEAYAHPNLSVVRPGITQLAGSGASTPQQPQLPQSNVSRQIHDSHFNISSDHRLHDKLVLVDTPESLRARMRVDRLAVVRPSSDNVIVVEGKKPTADGGTQRSVEAIYQVIGSSLSDSLATASVGRARRVHQAELGNSRAHVSSKHVDSASSAMHKHRPIAIPKSRVSSLRPAHRQLPNSRTVAEGGPIYTPRGSLAAHRPSTLMLLEEKEEVESTGSPGIVLTDSYYDDPGYDLVNDEIDSLFCQSFDMDMLPEAPERKVSHYNIGVKDVPRRSPTPSLKEEEEDKDGQMVHRTLGVVSHAAQFAKPVIREQDVDFYIRMLTLRAKANHADESSMPQPPPPRHVEFSEDSLEALSEQDEDGDGDVESVLHIPVAEAPRELMTNLSGSRAQEKVTTGSGNTNAPNSGQFSSSRRDSIGGERRPASVVYERSNSIPHFQESKRAARWKAPGI